MGGGGSKPGSEAESGANDAKAKSTKVVNESQKTASWRRKTFSLNAETEDTENKMTSRNDTTVLSVPVLTFRDCWKMKELPANVSAATLGDKASKNCLAARFAVFSRAGTSKGVPKTNQDTAVCVHPFNGSPTTVFAGVYDGHGMRGEMISQFVGGDLPKMVKKYMERRERKGWTVEQALQKAHEDTDLNLKFEAQTKGWNIDIAGTTAVSVYIADGKMYVCKVGDSRCVVAATCKKKVLDADQVMDDHSPDNETEQSRIESSGGCCSPFHGIGPNRVWLKGFENQKPGLAVTRSFGDLMAESVGVFATPEIKCVDLFEEDAEMVAVMSDGVFEHVPNQEVAVFLSQNANVHSSCENLVQEAAKRWEERIGHCDDISIVAFYVKQLGAMDEEEQTIHSKLVEES